MPKVRKHPGNITRRGASFLIRLCIGGRYHRFTVRTQDPKEAERFARSRYAELEAQFRHNASGIPVPIRVCQLLEKFLREELPLLAPGSRKTYTISIAFIRRFFSSHLGDPHVARVRPVDVQSFLAWRRTQRGGEGEGPISNRTVAKDRAVLHRLFALAEKFEYREGNPVSRIDAPKNDSRPAVILNSEEFERLLAACTDRPMLRLYVLLLGETGARCNSEALWLRWEDIDLEGGFLKIETGRDGHRTKSGRGRWTPMTARLASAVREHLASYRLAAYEGKRSPWVFHHTTSRRNHRPGQRITSLLHSFQGATKRAGLPKELRQHDLRHRRVTTWLAEGKNPVHVKEAVGHADLRTTMGYTHLVREHLKALTAETPRLSQQAS